MKIVLYIILVSSAVVCGLNNRCCEDGKVMLRRKTACWEPVTNSTVNITLACSQRAKQQMNYVLNDDGSLTFYYYSDLLKENRSVKLDSGQYCIGEHTTLNDVKLEKTEKVFVHCIDIDDSPISVNVKMYCMIVSAIFLLVTALVYSLLPELRDLLGKSIISYCISSAVAFIFFVIMGLVPYSDMTLCAVRGFLAYFFIMASFFWTNAISIQILVNMRRPYLYDRGWREFLWYSLYAWGCATALTICVVVANYHPGDHKRPGIGLMHCWFIDNNHWYYLFGPMAVLIVANIIIFSWCLYQLWSQRFDSSHVRAVRYKCMMSLRLFILMGIPWICEMISTATESGIVTAILDIFTTLQGVLTFVVLVLLRQRALKMMLKHGWLCCLSTAAEKRLALVEDVEDIAEHTVDYRLDDHRNNGVTG